MNGQPSINDRACCGHIVCVLAWYRCYSFRLEKRRLLQRSISMTGEVLRFMCRYRAAHRWSVLE